MVVFLHWLAEADEGRRRHRPGEQETLPCRNPPAQPRKAVGCSASATTSIVVFRRRCTERQADCTIPAEVGSIKPNDRLLPAISGRREGLSATGRSMRRTANFSAHARVNHRRRDVGMTEQILHGSNVVTAAEQGRRERVAEGVRCGGLRDACLFYTARLKAR